MIEAVNEIESTAAPFLAQRAQRREQRRLQLAGLSIRHIKLLFAAWMLRAFSGWSDSLLYTDSGERGIRSFAAGSVLTVPVMIAWGLFFGAPGPVAWVVILWAYALHWVERLSTRRHRESEEGYLYSYFIGWPRFLPPNKPASRWQQGAILAVFGLIVGVWDISGGFLLAVTGLCVLLHERVASLIEREELLDFLDAGWLQSDREATRTAAAVATQGTGTTADTEDPWERAFGSPEEREILKHS